MNSSVALQNRPREDKHLALPLIGEARGRQAPVNGADHGWILSLVARAIDRTMPRKEAAYLLGIDQGQMSRQLAGDGHLSVLRLGALPADFWTALADEIREHFGLLDRAALVEQGEALIDRGRQLLAKAASR